MRNPTDMQTAAAKFAEVCEAYDVLSNSKFSYVDLFSCKQSNLRPLWTLCSEEGNCDTEGW